MKLKAIETLQDIRRISSIDMFRGIAIVSVVIFHFGFFPYGFLGVDLFFVISGILIGGILLNEFKSSERINYFRFLLSRGFKIWPSYYILLTAGNLIAWLLYRNSHSNQFIPLWDMKRYIFFYQNYTGVPFHFSFDGIWSLCVEEHFYILLPLIFLFVQSAFIKVNQKKWLLMFIMLAILMGIIFKFISFYFTHSQDTYSATHNRIDALGWGVLFSFILKYYGDVINKLNRAYLYSLAGSLFLVLIIAFDVIWNNIFYTKVILHSLVPIAFVIIIFGAYNYNFSKLKAIRFIAYYSYNWYLWHPVFYYLIYDAVGKTFPGLIIYLFITFLIAMFFTILVEEPALNFRPVFLRYMFKLTNAHHV